MLVLPIHEFSFSHLNQLKKKKKKQIIDCNAFLSNQARALGVSS